MDKFDKFEMDQMLMIFQAMAMGGEKPSEAIKNTLAAIMRHEDVIDTLLGRDDAFGVMESATLLGAMKLLFGLMEQITKMANTIDTLEHQVDGLKTDEKLSEKTAKKD